MKTFEYENYLGSDDFIFVEAVKSCNDLAILVINKLIENKVRVYYDSDYKNDCHSSEEVANMIKNANKIIFIMSNDTSSSLRYRNMVNYALAIKKDILIIKDKEFNYSHGLDMQLANINYIIFNNDTYEKQLFDLEIINQDVIGTDIKKRNIDNSKKKVLISLISLLLLLFVVSIFVIKNRFDYYKSPEYIYKDITSADYIDASIYGYEAIDALKEIQIGELNLSNCNLSTIKGIENINAEVVNIAHNPDISDINLIYYCKNLKKIICSQDMLEMLISYNTDNILIEVVN